MLQHYNVIYVMQLQIMHFDYQKKLSLLCTNVSCYIVIIFLIENIYLPVFICILNDKCYYLTLSS